MHSCDVSLPKRRNHTAGMRINVSYTAQVEGDEQLGAPTKNLAIIDNQAGPFTPWVF
jgi:hypothetical protein